MTERVTGLVERITYHNPENGFCVIRVKVKGNKNLVTITGKVPSIVVGEYVESTGDWYNDKNHGPQFKAEFLKALAPTTLEGMEKYLGSGLIRGIGPAFASRLIKAFGLEVFNVIENKPESLYEVSGIGKSRVESIIKNWHEQKIVREIMVFLQSHGVGSTRAHRIYKTYGEDAINVVKSNPYKLADDIRGIGFKSADVIAANLGIAKDSMIRARAGVSFVLLDATSNGHTGLPTFELISNIIKLIEIDDALASSAIELEIVDQNLVRSTIDGAEVIFLSSYFFFEKNISWMLDILSKGNFSWSIKGIDNEINVAGQELNITLAELQKKAAKTTLLNKVSIITGGPGTGKTTLVNSILHILRSQNIKISLAAPTGRASKRLSSSTGMEAMTIHRLLEIDPINGGFKRNEDWKLDCDYLVIDEASMLDVSLMHALLNAIPERAGLLFVGDVDQLPSVGAGSVLGDMISSGKITVTELKEVFRQALSSKIIEVAHTINKGIIPDLSHKTDSDFDFIEAEPGDDLLNKLIDIVQHRIPDKFNCHPVNDIQILAPQQVGGSGVRSLNVELQKILNPDYEKGALKYGQYFAVNDKVMQTENDYDKEVYNGDIGIISKVNHSESEITIRFDEKEVIYEYNDLDKIAHAYATTIHKSQGSEYKIVIIPLTMSSYMMLQKNLIYTAITRGKEFVVIIGEKKALNIAIKSNKTKYRYTKLKEWLMNI